MDDLTAELGAAGYRTKYSKAMKVGVISIPGRGRPKCLLNVFGDQYRVLEHLYEELQRGAVVVSVDEPDTEGEAVAISQITVGVHLEDWILDLYPNRRVTPRASTHMCVPEPP